MSPEVRHLYLVRHSDVTAGHVTEHRPEAVPEFGIHPAVDEGVVHAVAHGQPVTSHPDVVHALRVVDGRVYVPRHVDDVQRKPTRGVNHHHHDHHPDYLKRQRGLLGSPT